MRVIGVAGEQCRKSVNLAVIEMVAEAVVELLQRELSLNPGRDVQSIAPADTRLCFRCLQRDVHTTKLIVKLIQPVFTERPFDFRFL